MPEPEAAPSPPTPPEPQGLRTSEYRLSLVALLLGAAMILLDKHAELGAEIVIWAVTGYTASRGLVKGAGAVLGRRA